MSLIPDSLCYCNRAIDQTHMEYRTVDIHGISIGSSHYKLSLYADDTLLYFSNQDSFLAALYLLEEFGARSGLTVNHHKLTLFPINLYHADKTALKTKYTYKRNIQLLLYLGVTNPAHENDILKLNCKKGDGCCSEKKLNLVTKRSHGAIDLIF